MFSHMAALHISTTWPESLLPLPQRKESDWSLGGFKPSVFHSGKSLQLFPPTHTHTVMLSFSGRLSSWRVGRAFQVLWVATVIRHMTAM